MLGLITDRQQSNVDRLKELSSKGWSNMTDAEKAEWIGDPKATEGANILSHNLFRQQTVAIDYRLNTLTCTAMIGGRYQYGGIYLGPASDFEGKTITVSYESTAGTPNTIPRIGLYWHDNSGYYEFAGLEIWNPGSVTVTLTPNAQNRQFLAAYVYVSTTTAVDVGARVRYNGVMVSVGNTKYPFTPYVEVAATPTTMGAYNYSDLNRVERAATELSELYGLGLLTKTDWTAVDVPSEQTMNRYLSNIRTIRAVCPNPGSLPDLPTSMKGLTYEVANDIEKILVAAYEGAAGAYSVGELYSGEV